MTTSSGSDKKNGTVGQANISRFVEIFSLQRSILPDLRDEVLAEGKKLEMEGELWQLPKDGLGDFRGWVGEILSLAHVDASPSSGNNLPKKLATPDCTAVVLAVLEEAEESPPNLGRRGHHGGISQNATEPEWTQEQPVYEELLATLQRLHRRKDGSFWKEIAEAHNSRGQGLTPLLEGIGPVRMTWQHEWVLEVQPSGRSRPCALSQLGALVIFGLLQMLALESTEEGNNYQDDLPPSSPPAPSPPPYLAEDEALDTEEPPPMGESDASGSNYSSDVRRQEKQEKQEATKATALPNIPRAMKAHKVPLKTTALLSDLEMDEEEDISGDDDNNEDSDDNEGHEDGKAQRKGPLTAECRYNFWNIHQAWFYGMQAEGEDPAVLKQHQHEHYQQIKATPKGSLNIQRPKKRVEEGGRQAAGMWAGSKVVISSIEKYGVDLKKMINWWMMTLKYESANIQASEEADRDRNWCALKYMFLDLLGSPLTTELQFNEDIKQHLGDRYDAELKEIAENLKRSKGKGKGKVKHRNDEDNEDNEEVVQPDPDDNIWFVKIERSKDGQKQTPLLVSRKLEDLFYVRDLEPVGDNSCPNILEGPEVNEGENEDEDDRRRPCSPSPRECSPLPFERSPIPRSPSTSPQHSPAGSVVLTAHDWGPVVETHVHCHLRITASISTRHDVGGTMQIKPNLARDFIMANQGRLRLLPPTSVNRAERGLLRVIMTNPITGVMMM
ncbi:hypothetical protein BDN67DRAFT_984696 [Paxillus ammoniavirescens]|nr:hypothetical protein BDN67DRAFT_984696 [Paxillus ammoniavirescens]